MEKLPLITAKYSEASGFNSYFTLPKGDILDILLKNNVLLGGTLFTVYDIKVLQSISTESKFSSSALIVYTKDLIAVTDKVGNLLSE